MSYKGETEKPLDSSLSVTPDFARISQAFRACYEDHSDLASLDRVLPKPKSGFYQVMALRASEPFPDPAPIPGAYAAIATGNDLLVLSSREDAQRVVDVLLANHPGAQAALSLPFNSAADLDAQGKVLRFCLDGHYEETLINAEDHVLDYIIVKVSENPRFKSLAHPALQKLADYDKANRSDLYNTLYVYLENDRNAQRCADALYLHRNSLQYRVRRIQEITGLDLSDAQLRSYLRVSFLIRAEDKL